jgi:hypothetical protein
MCNTVVYRIVHRYYTSYIGKVFNEISNKKVNFDLVSHTVPKSLDRKKYYSETVAGQKFFVYNMGFLYTVSISLLIPSKGRTIF